MTFSMDNLWLVILVVAGFTYLARSLPFFLSEHSKLLNRMAEPESVLAVLGPCLLVSITAATLLPILYADLLMGDGLAWPTFMGLAGTLGVMKLWGDVGLAVIVGMLCYALGGMLLL
jgi:branched-subunit amino acid transport protein